MKVSALTTASQTQAHNASITLTNLIFVRSAVVTKCIQSGSVHRNVPLAGPEKCPHTHTHTFSSSSSSSSSFFFFFSFFFLNLQVAGLHFSIFDFCRNTATFLVSKIIFSLLVHGKQAPLLNGRRQTWRHEAGPCQSTQAS